MNVSAFKIEYEIDGQEGHWQAVIVSSKYRLAVKQLVAIVGKKINITSSGKEVDIHNITPEVIEHAATAIGYVKPKKTKSRRTPKKPQPPQPLADDGYAFTVDKIVK